MIATLANVGAYQIASLPFWALGIVAATAVVRHVYQHKNGDAVMDIIIACGIALVIAAKLWS